MSPLTQVSIFQNDRGTRIKDILVNGVTLTRSRGGVEEVGMGCQRRDGSRPTEDM